jgi:hypothetical protein
MKKMFFLAIFIVVLTGGVFAQTARNSAPKNWIYGQVGFFNFGAGYERVLTPLFSVGGEAYWNSFFLIWNNYAVEGFGKIYPFRNVGFYAKVGVGYGQITGGLFIDDYYDVAGLLVDPGIGFKIDPGRAGGFFLEPKLSVPLVFGVSEYLVYRPTYYGGYYAYENRFRLGVNFVVALAMGFAF